VKKSTYDLADLIKECGKKVPSVTVLGLAMDTARTDFSLDTQPRVFEFIRDGGLEKAKPINTKALEYDESKAKGKKASKGQKRTGPAPMVDAYEFYSGFNYGYIAFYFSNITKRWIIKSFKKNLNEDTRNFALKESLSKLQKKINGGLHG